MRRHVGQKTAEASRTQPLTNQEIILLSSFSTMNKHEGSSDLPGRRQIDAFRSELLPDHPSSSPKPPIGQGFHHQAWCSIF